MKKVISIFFVSVLALGVVGPVRAENLLVPGQGISVTTADGLYVNVSGDTVTGSFAVDGDTTLGDAIGDTVTYNAGTFAYDSDSSFTFSLDAIFTAAKGLIRFDTPTTEVTGNLEVQGNTEIGDAVGDTLAIKAGTITHPNATTINYDATTIFDALGQSFSFKGVWTLIGDTGVVVDPAGDVDTDLITVASTGTPKLSYDDGGPDDFVFSEQVVVPDAGIATHAINRQTGDARYHALASVKSGTVAGATFAGNPKVFTVTFNTAFPDTNYAVSIEGEDNRNWTFQTKLAGSFVMNANANLALVGDVDWAAIAHNDP